MESNTDSVLSAVAAEHASHPQNYGPLETFNGHATLTGPCGDTMVFWLLADNKVIKQVSFITTGCGPSFACGSMATSLTKGRHITEAVSLGQKDILEALGGLPAEVEHCALLAANALRAACDDFLTGSVNSGSSACGTCSKDDCSADKRNQGESMEDFESRKKLLSRLCRIKHKIVVLSGKGGVGKSTVAVNLSMALTLHGKRVGLLDVDIHGPSVPTMLGLEGVKIASDKHDIYPVNVDGLKIMSAGFFLESPDDALIWRGPMKMSVIKQFLTDVAWGELDYLIIDSPPGTGDEPLSLCQLIGDMAGAVIVTTPQKVASMDVRKSITFCRTMKLPVLGIIENMSGFICPHCGEVTSILGSGGAKTIVKDMNVSFLGAIPMDTKMAEAGDSGQVFVKHNPSSTMAFIMQNIINRIEGQNQGRTPETVE